MPFEVLRRQVMISGDQLIDAKQSYDPQSGLPVVTTYHTLFEEYLQHYVPLLPAA